MALTGFLHNGICFDSYNAAMSVKFGSDPVLETTATQGDQIHFYQMLPDGLWYWSEYSTQGSAWTLQYHSPMPQISFTSCDPADTFGTNAAMFAEGMAMGWGVVAAMAAALAVIFLKNALVVR